MELLFQKQFASELTAPETPDAVLMELVNRYAGESVQADEVLVRYAHLANDQYDRSHERFTVPILKRFAETMTGKSLLTGHNREEAPIGKWLLGSVIQDDQSVNHLKIPFYMDQKSEMARRVRLGIAKSVSISFKAAGRTCDLCGAEYDGGNGCENGHRKGQLYDGKLCTITYSGDPSRYEGMEGSLVWLGCQYGAEVTGAKTFDLYGGRVLLAQKSEELMTEKEIAELQAKAVQQDDMIKGLELRAKSGDAYHEWLKGEIARKMSAPLVAKPDEAKTKADTILKTLGSANLETLLAWDKLATAEFDKAFPPSTQTLPLGEGGTPAPPRGEEPPPHTQRLDPHMSRKRF